MKIIATIDYWDGSPGEVKELYPEDIVSGRLGMLFTSARVASITLTKPPNLVKAFEIDSKESS